MTYLKLYEDKDFNYVAYNTVRMYDAAFTKKTKCFGHDRERHSLLSGRVRFDGARIDMGHALPHKLEKLDIDKAREIDPISGSCPRLQRLGSREEERL